ncbi:hypothetical protein BGW36DRAFT_301440, partial [Talaromyces proteolyticus]
KTRELLEKYSGIPPSQQSEHVHRIRDQAWNIRVYPCTGLGVWLVPTISRSPAYAEILALVKTGARYLDVGCFIGQDMRRLVYDGAPSTNLYGVDIVSHWAVGFDMFRDKATFSAQFIEADFMDTAESAGLAALEGSVDVIFVSQVLHQWGWEGQVKAVKRLVEFSRVGTLVVGCQIGTLDVGGVEVEFGPVKVPLWRHDPVSFDKLWQQVGLQTGSKWAVQAWLRTWEDMGWDPRDQAFLGESARVIEFVVRRVK